MTVLMTCLYKAASQYRYPIVKYRAINN